MSKKKAKQQAPRLYIAYGSNLNLPQMAHRCPTARVVGSAEIKDYELLFRGARRGGVATIEPMEGASVPVLVWDIKPQDEAALDRYEGYPHLYEKEMVPLEMDGRQIEATVYVMTPGHHAGMPSLDYFRTILEGYKMAGFDASVLEQAVNRSMELMEQEQAKVRLQEQEAAGKKWQMGCPW